MQITRSVLLMTLLWALILSPLVLAQTTYAEEVSPPAFRAGAAAINVSPWSGVSMAGYFNDRKTAYVHDELHARALVLDDGTRKLAFVVVDSCMIARETMDEAKKTIFEKTGISGEQVIMAATHSHTAPTSAHVFQSEPDPQYKMFLIAKMADAVVQATQNLEPAQIAWGSGQLPGPLNNRRWKMKPGTVPESPLGVKTEQVQMNPPVAGENLLEPAGPIDPEVSFIAVRSVSGVPIALLGNYSLHYVGGEKAGHASADYFGYFTREIERLLEVPAGNDPPFVGILTNGTSGDVNNINFRQPNPPRQPYEQMQRVAREVAAEVYRAYQQVKFHDAVTLDSEQIELEFKVRKPNEQELVRAKEILAAATGRELTGGAEVYARETVLINDWPDTVKLLVQGHRIGDLAIATIPCEVFTEIGLAIKASSAIKPAFTIELANGYNGYLPTPQQHAWGGYETWRAKSSYLEVTASDTIVSTLLECFNRMSVRRPVVSPETKP